MRRRRRRRHAARRLADPRSVLRSEEPCRRAVGTRRLHRRLLSRSRSARTHAAGKDEARRISRRSSMRPRLPRDDGAVAPVRRRGRCRRHDHQHFPESSSVSRRPIATSATTSLSVYELRDGRLAGERVFFDLDELARGLAVDRTELQAASRTPRTSWLDRLQTHRRGRRPRPRSHERPRDSPPPTPS